MAVGEIDLEKFGAMTARVETLLGQNETLFSKVDKVAEAVGKLEVTASAVTEIIKKHDNEIKELRSRPVKIVELGMVAISAVCAGICAWFSRGN